MIDKIRLGAIDIETKEYTLPSKASKGRMYECVDCKKRVILRQGNVRVHHFAHYTQTNLCSYYDHPNEAQIHKDAKLLIQKLLQEKNLISFTWNCDNCSGFWGLEELPSFKYKDGDEALLEYRDPNGKWIADVALVNNNNVRCIIEIKNKHTTTTQRPEPWFEIDATNLHKIINEQIEIKKDIEKETEGYTPPFIFEIPCIRQNTNRKCYGCFCYKEPWVRRIPGFNKENIDNSCLLCKRTEEYIPTFDGCTGRFQDGCIRVCQDCLLKDTYDKKLRQLYSTDIERLKEIVWAIRGTVNIKQGSNDLLSSKEKQILSKIPQLWKRFGQETQWKQASECIECKRSSYSPVYMDKKYYGICKVCFDNESVQQNIIGKIKEGKITTEEKCLITDS
jgi:hypothetical protein